MAEVLQEKNQIFLWTNDFLFFEWKIERSDVVHSFSYDLYFKSIDFKLDGLVESFLDFVYWKKEESAKFQFISAGRIRSRNIRILILDKYNSIAYKDFANTDSYYCRMKDNLSVTFNISSSLTFPITIIGIISNPNSTPCHKQPDSIERSTATNDTHSIDSAPKSNVGELLEDFKKIFDDPIYSDIDLKVEEVNIKAHKMVLHARSPVFQKMLCHDTTETVDNTISICDISAPVMKKFIAYLYTGQKEECDFEECCELYYAADKYEVMSLREACRVELLTHLQVDNACTLLGLANRHSDEIFVEAVAQFMNANFKTVVESKSFDALDKDDLKVLMRLQVRAMTK